MSEVDTIAADERRHRAEALLAASRPSREAAAAAHARSTPRGEQDDDGLVRISLEELQLSPYRMTEAERARILGMTEKEIEAAALVDPTIRRGPTRSWSERCASVKFDSRHFAMCRRL